MSKAKHEHNPVIHDCSAFKRWSRDERKVQKGTIGGYVSDLRRISDELGIEINPETISNYIDADKLADRLAEKNIDKNLGGVYRNAARRYADFVQASKSAEEDDETRCNEASIVVTGKYGKILPASVESCRSVRRRNARYALVAGPPASSRSFPTTCSTPASCVPPSPPC